jgi:hypothetical protein
LNISERELARRVLREYMASVLDRVVTEDAVSVGNSDVVCTMACWNTASAFERIGTSDIDDGACWEMIRLFELEATATLICSSRRTRRSSEPTDEPRLLVGIVDTLEGVLAMAMEISLMEDREMAEDIGVTKEVAICSDKFTTGLMTDVESTFSGNVVVATGRGVKRLTT